MFIPASDVTIDIEIIMEIAFYFLVLFCFESIENTKNLLFLKVLVGLMEINFIDSDSDNSHNKKALDRTRLLQKLVLFSFQLAAQ